MPRLAIRSTTALALVLTLPLMAAGCENPPADSPAWHGGAGNQSSYESHAGSPATTSVGAAGAVAASGKSGSVLLPGAAASGAGSPAAPASGSAGAKAASSSPTGSAAAPASNTKPAAAGAPASSSAPAATGGSPAAGAGGSAAHSGSAGGGAPGNSDPNDPFAGIGDPGGATPSGSGTRDPNGPCKDLMLFCFDPFDMFTLNPECLTCNNGQGCMDCVNFQAI